MNKIVITITLDLATGNIRLEGPIQDKVLALGLIELAKGIVMSHKPTQEPPIYLPNGYAPRINTPRPD